jgi:hypothetical protein
VTEKLSKFSFGSRGLSLAALALTVLTLSGCHHFFGNDEQVKDPLQLKEQGLSCVRSVGADLSKFFNGEDRDPVMVVDCISSALAKFASNTRGANPDGWTRSELSSFFETYFREESQAPDVAKRTRNGLNSTELATTTAAASVAAPTTEQSAAVEVTQKPVEDTGAVAPFDGDWVAQARRRAVVGELFRWKASLLGGGDQTLSRIELERIRGFLAKVRTPLANWRGRGQVLSFHQALDEKQVTVQMLEEITTAVRALGAALNEELLWDGGGKTRPRESMRIQTIAQSLEQAGIKSLSTHERKQFVQTVKSIAVAGDPAVVQGSEWPVLVQQATELWIGALRFKYGANDLDTAEKMIADLGLTLNRMIERHGGRIEIDLLKNLLVQLEGNKLLPAMIKVKSVNNAMDVILGKLLAGNSHPKKAELTRGLMKDHADRIVEIFRDWIEGERVATEIAGPANFATLEQSRVTMSQIATRAKEPVGEIARVQMSELILRGRPLVHDLQGRMLVVPTEQIHGYRRSDLSTLNLSRVLVNVAMRAYANESGRAGSMPQLTEDEAQEVFTDLKAIGTDAGLVDIRSLQSGNRTFMEANIFLSVSDGNQYMSMHESVEWFATIMSAGKTADLIHADLLPNCGTAPLDVFGRQRLKAKCFRDGIFPVLRTRMSHLPNVTRALNQIERSRTTPAFLRALERASRPLGETDLPFESSEIRVISPILHYAESLFARHDTNNSSLLDEPEVWGIFPLIQPFIQKMAAGLELSQGEERAIFSWLLTEGEPPKTTTSGKIRLKLHQGQMAVGLTDERATIQDIVTILASFNQVGREKRNADVIAYYKENRSQWDAGISRSDRKTFEMTRKLFHCANEADTDLSRVFLSRRADIFAVDSKLDEDEQAAAFLNRAKSIIQSDPQLQLTCMAF